jgi:hypothetical protein
MKQQTTTKTTYTIEGVAVEDLRTIRTIKLDGDTERHMLADIVESGHFTFHMPEMWADKGGYREPAYNTDCIATKVSKMTEVTIRTWEDSSLEDLARDLQ